MAKIVDAAIDAVVAGITPPDDSDPRVRRWRWFMAGSLVLIGAGLLLHMTWSVGAYPFEGEGFVEKKDFASLANDVRAGRLNSLRTAIHETQKELCAQPNGTPYRAMLAETLTSLKLEWTQLTGESYPVPDCSVL